MIYAKSQWILTSRSSFAHIPCINNGLLEPGLHLPSINIVGGGA